MRKIGLITINPSTFDLSEVIKEIIIKNEYKNILYCKKSSFTCDPKDFIENNCLNTKYIAYLSSNLKEYNKEIIGLQVIDNNFKQDDIGVFSAIGSKNSILISTLYIKSDNRERMKHRMIVTLLHELGENIAHLLGYTHFTLVLAKHDGECVFHPPNKKLFEWIRKGKFKYIAKYKDSLPEYYCSRCSEIIKEGIEVWHEI